MNNKNNNVYILSLEASDIYAHMNRDKKLKDDFCGMIPQSKELTKLKSIGLKTTINKTNNKELSRDIINVKFRFKVKGVEDIINKTRIKILKLQEKIKEIEDLIYSEENILFGLLRLKESNKVKINKQELKNSILELEKYIKYLKKKEVKLQKDLSNLEKYIEYLMEDSGLNKYNDFKENIISLEEYTNYVKEKEIIFSAEVEEKEKDPNDKKKTIITKIEKDFYKWDEVKNSILREDYFYKNGFTITTINKNKNKKTNEITETITETKYVVYKRSTSKSRTGQCLFIKEDLYKQMINWSRMNLPFVEGMDIDYAGLLAAETLVNSSLEDVITINSDNILIVNDVEDEFEYPCNIIRIDSKTGRLNSFENKDNEHKIKNSLFDGESLLEAELFKGREEQGMILLRNHMFKSCAFNTNLQKYLKDNCPENIEYDKWEIKNMFNQPIFAKDIKMVITPSSLKALKFAKNKNNRNLNMTELDIWEHWKKTVKDEGCIFGIVKHEKESKRGKDEKGNILQQSSYQIINSLEMNDSDIKELTIFEREFISKLKNDDNFFLEYALENANEVNCNKMFVEVAKYNKDFINTLLFRNFRKRLINDHVTHCKKGKIRLPGDYCVLFGSCLEFLQHTIGKFDIDKVDVENLPLKDNEVYTKLHENNKELVMFRNPNTSPSNCLVAKNKYIEDIDKYFNLSKNIVCVNAIKFPIQDILSSCDYDSDTAVIFDQDRLLKICKKIYGKYNVCINDVQANKKLYKLTNQDMAKIDNQLATSQKNIGKTVNTGQLCMSNFWDLKSKGASNEELEPLMKSVDVMTVLSCIAIDLCKKFYDIDINKEINNVKKTKGLQKLNPLFWQYVSETKGLKDIGKLKKDINELTKKEKKAYKLTKYNCPMDLLIEEMTGLPNPDTQHPNIEFSKLLIKHKLRDADRKQEDSILEYVEKMCTKINSVNAYYKNDDDEDEVEEKNNLLSDTIKYCHYYLNKKRNVTTETMYSIIFHMLKNNNTDIQARLLNALFTTHKKEFLSVFIRKLRNKYNIYKKSTHFKKLYFKKPL